MKLWKKALAVVLAGVLMLSALTGCGGSGNGTSKTTIIDALNHWSDYYGEKYVFKAGDSALQAKTNELAKTIEDAAKKLDFSEANGTAAKFDVIRNDAQTMQKIQAVLNFPQAGIDDGSPAYMLGLAEMDLSADSPKDKNLYYARQLCEETENINMPPRDYTKPAEWTYGEKIDASVATLTVDGQQYMIALFKTTLVSR